MGTVWIAETSRKPEHWPPLTALGHRWSVLIRGLPFGIRDSGIGVTITGMEGYALREYLRLKKEEIAAWTSVQLYEALQHRGDDELRRRLGRTTLASVTMDRHMQNRLQGKTARSAYSSVLVPSQIPVHFASAGREEVEMSCKWCQSTTKANSQRS